MSTLIFVFLLVLVGGVLLYWVVFHTGGKFSRPDSHDDLEVDAEYECHYCGEKNCECQRKDRDRSR